MPIYEYTCQYCGEEFEFLVRGDQQASCPSCRSGRLTKNLSVPAAHSAGSTKPSCPARDACGMPHCPGNSCGMAEWM
jgi:putative FmdB family regulatory protein